MQPFLAGIEPAARVVAVTLFNSLWEAALLAAVVALVLRVLPNVNATTRYAAWCVALGASLLLPLVTAIPQIQVCFGVSSSSTHTQTQTVSSPKHATPVIPPAEKYSIAEKAIASETSSPSSAPAFRLPERMQFVLPQYVALTIFIGWCLAALLLIVRFIVNLWRLERLKSDALPLPLEYRERLERWARADKGEREVRLCTCESIEVPVAVGLFDSMILIPKHLLDTLSQTEIDQIILHELAHLRRADDWTNGFQRFIQALFFFNPAVLYIAQQLDLEREVACDDWVVDQTKEVRPYATCLTKMAEVTAWPHRPLAAPGVFVTRRGLSVRVERLLRAGRNVRTSISFGPAGAIVASLIVLFFVLQSVAPSFAFTLPQEEAAVPAMPVAAATKHKVAQPKAGANTVVKEKTKTLVVYKYETPAPKASAVDVNIPAMNVNVPAQHVHVPAQHLHVALPNLHPVPKVHVTFGPDFPGRMHAVSESISRTVSQTVSQSMAQAFSGKGGKFSCVGCDFSSQNLEGKSFRGQQLSGPDFSHANLRNADFSYSVLVGADFARADLRGANFSHAKLTGCDLSHADITGVNFDDVTMVGCDVNARGLAPAQAGALLRGCRTGCDFSYADLSGQDLRNLSLSGVDLSHANLRGADLSGSQLRGIDLSGATLDGARFNGADISGCDFSNVNLRNVDLSNARISGSKLSDSNY
jgi:uncharacterized protein YjbI with pentapeptide repeats/beta-lactamase regulating signal transducer with metallopeptidase domain